MQTAKWGVQMAGMIFKHALTSVLVYAHQKKG
ncbi:DUF6783 domain-containing protein [uncultured Robinsoniella sp.]